jgi:deaminated glutathione amidase
LPETRDTPRPVRPATLMEDDMADTKGASLRVAVAQMNSRDDKPKNIETALRLIDRAAATGARLITLPEVWTFMGPDAGKPAAAEPIPGPLTDLLAERARRHGVYLHAGSYFETRPGEPRLFNTTVVFGPTGELVARYSKIHLFDVELDGVAVYQESAAVAPGDEIVTFDCDGFTVGLTICYDVRFPELYRILALRGAEVILHPAAFTMTTGKDHWETLIRARAIENTVYMVSPAQVGEADGKWCYGRSMIVNPWGTVLATAPDEETVIVADLDRALLDKVRRQVPSLRNRQPGAYRWPEVGAGVAD